MTLPLLIAKEGNQTMLPDDYKLGWLFEDDKKAYWMIWASSKSKELALSVAKEVIEKQGKRNIFLSDVPLSKYPTKEQIADLKQIQI